MNDLSHDFWNSLGQAAERLSSGLRIESGINSRPHIVARQDGNVLVFITDDTTGPTLKRYLGPILDAAVKSTPPLSEISTTVDPQDYPELDGKGLVSVCLTPPLIGYLTARLE